MSSEADIAIVELLVSKQTENRGVNLLIDVHGAGMYRFILTYTRQEADADDVFQEVLIKVVRKIRSFKKEASLKTWLWAVCRNEALDFLRKRNRIRMKEGNPMDSSGKITTHDPFFTGDEILALLHSAANQLPEVQKEVFHMRYFEEMSYREMAEITGKSEGGLKASFFHASKKVSEAIKQQL